MPWTRGRKLGTFLALTFVSSWSLAIAFYAMGGDFGGSLARPLLMLFVMPPAFFALLIKGPITKEPIVEHLGLSFHPNLWFVGAWLFPVVAIALSAAVATSFGLTFTTDIEHYLSVYQGRVPEAEWASFEENVRAMAAQGEHPLMRQALQALVAGITLALFYLGQELGFRGFLHEELGARGSSGRVLIRQSAMIGAIWGVWWAPLVAQGYLFPEHSAVGVLLVIVFSMLASVALGIFREHAKSTIASAVMLATWISCSNLLELMLAGGNDLTVGLASVPSIVALGLLLVPLTMYERRRETTP